MDLGVISSPALARMPISAEARGLARDFCRRVGDESRLMNQQGIGGPLRSRMARYPNRRPRDSMLRDLERDWRAACPQSFRLDFHSSWRGKSFAVSERAVTLVDAFRLLHWNDDDYGVCVTDTWMRVDRDVVSAGVRSRMWVGSHALARWYQRSGVRTDERLLQDIAAGAAIDPDDRTAFPDLDDVRVAVNAGGEAWRGALMLAPEDEDEGLIFYAKTFV
jgi:hypothetical protein